MIAVPPQAAHGLNQQREFVVIQRTLQATHHRDFILQATLQVDGTTLLKVFRVVRGERQVSHYPQLAQHQIEVVDGRTYIAVAHAHLRLQRYAIPEKAELFDMLVQSFNPLLVRFRVKANRQVTAREVINLFVGLELALIHCASRCLY